MDAGLNPVSDDGGGGALGQTAAGDIGLMGAKSNELLFAQAVDPTPPNEEAVGLIFDINPLDPGVIAVVGAVVVCLVAATWWCRRKPSKTSRATTTLATGGGTRTVSAATDRTSSPVIQSRYDTRGHGLSTPGSRRSARRASSPASANRSSPPGKVMILTPQQLALCEVLYDVYNGAVSSRGIESKAVQECDLSTADIRRQFKNIKRARELDRENPSSSDNNGSGAPPSSPTPRRASQSRLTRPSTRRASIAAAATDTKQQPEAGKQPSSRTKESSRMPVPSKRTAAAAAAATTTAPSTKKPPVSPRSTPVKRGAAARPGTASGGGGSRGSPARAAKRASPSSPSGRSAAASVLPSSPPESPMRTRGRNNRTASVRIGSPKSAPTKRAAAAAAAAASSPRSGGGGTPSKRGKPSVLEIARREAQQQTVDVASTRASSLRARRSSRSNTNTATRRGTKS